MAKRCLLAMGVVLVMILITLSAWAVPTMMNYQGKLTDKNGIPLNDTYNMTFYLFTAASGGTAIWTENHTSVTVTDGIYNVILGSINPLVTGLFIDNDQLYLEVEIEGETFAPRQQLTSAPYALKARVSDGVVHGAITTVMIEDGAVDSQKLENSSVTGTKIADGTVSYLDIQDGSTLEEIKDDDGADSGLDADKLDGLEASAFMASGADNWVDENGDTMTGPLTASVTPLGGEWTEAIKGTLLGPTAVGAGVYGHTEGSSASGVYGVASGTEGRGVVGLASGTTGTGVQGVSWGTSGMGVFAYANANTGTNFGVYGKTDSPDGYGGYFVGRGYFSDNVGIGTWEPGAKLHVRHSGSGLTPTNLTGLLVENSGNGNDYFVFQTATTGGGKSFSITNAGKVGIGTTSPRYKLDVAGRARMLTGGDNSAGIWFTNKDDSENRAFFGMNGDDLLGFYGQGGAGWGLVFNVNNGNVGIGTTSPTQKLDVAGNARFRNIGGGTPPLYPLSVDSNGVLTAAYPSDRRLKTNIVNIEDGLKIVEKLQGVRFNWKENPEGERRIGLIAQDVEEVVPELTFTNPVDGYMGINYAELSSVLIEAVKEQQQTIDKLTLRVDELETNKKAEIESLKDQLTSLQKVVQTLIAQQSDFKDKNARLSMPMWR